jgi:Tfp pilus assembly protein PilF
MRAISAAPEIPVLRSNYAQLLDLHARHSEALVQIDISLQLNPHSVLANAVRGEILNHLGRADDAEGSYRTAISFSPASFLANSLFAQFLLAHDRRSAALAHINALRANHADNLEALHCAGQILAIAGEYAEADTALIEALRLSPNEIAVIGKRIRVLEVLGNLEAAAQLFSRAMQIAPSHPLVLALHAKALASAGEVDRGRHIHEAILSAAPDEPGANRAYGAFLYRIGDFGGALKRFERALLLRPDSPELHADVACVDYLVGRRETARSHAERALSISWCSPNARIESLFYLVAHETDWWATGLARIARLLRAKAHVAAWDFEPHVQSTIQKALPARVEVLRTLADVVSLRQPATVLGSLAEWTAHENANGAGVD